MVNALQVNALGKVFAAAAFTGHLNLAVADALSVQTVAPEDKSVAKWNEACKFTYTKRDYKKFAFGHGLEYVYHGAPEEYADSLIRSGVHQYSAVALGREVAARYHIPWKLYYKYSPRLHNNETFSTLSTAPILVAIRWASNFKQGEMLSQLNEEARVLRYLLDHLNLKMNQSIGDQYEILMQKLDAMPGTHSFSIGQLGIPDLYPRSKSTGAIVQLLVPIDKIHNAFDAKGLLSYMGRYKEEENDIIINANQEYHDMRIDPQYIKAMRIVVRGIPFRTTNAVKEAEDSKRYMIGNRSQLIRVM